MPLFYLSGKLSSRAGFYRRREYPRHDLSICNSTQHPAQGRLDTTSFTLRPALTARCAPLLGGLDARSASDHTTISVSARTIEASQAQSRLGFLCCRPASQQAESQHRPMHGLCGIQHTPIHPSSRLGPDIPSRLDIALGLELEKYSLFLMGRIVFRHSF